MMCGQIIFSSNIDAKVLSHQRTTVSVTALNKHRKETSRLDIRSLEVVDNYRAVVAIGPEDVQEVAEVC